MNDEIKLIIVSMLFGSFTTLFILDIFKFGLSTFHIAPAIVGIVVIYVIYKVYKDSIPITYT